MSDLGYDAGWDLVGHFERAIEDAADEPQLPPAEHALMAAGELERTWLADHDREVAARALREAAPEYREGALTGMFLSRTGYTRAWLHHRADKIERGENV